MITDIVIDTNVLMHADNTTIGNQKDCVSFLGAMKDSAAMLCVDEGASWDEGKNKSQIMSEYLNRLAIGGVGRATIEFLAANSRLKLIEKKVDATVAKKINQAVPDRTDRVFVKVAYNSSEKVLASHDNAAFPTQTRKGLKKNLNISIVVAKAALALVE